MGTNERMEQIADKIIKLCHYKLGIEVTPSDISTAHRIELKSSNAALITVRFIWRSIRDMVHRLRFQSKNHNKSSDKSLHIYINEDLTNKNLSFLQLHAGNFRMRVCSLRGHLAVAFLFYHI